MKLRHAFLSAVTLAFLTIGVTSANAVPALSNDPSPAKLSVSTPIADYSNRVGQRQFGNANRYRYGNGYRYRNRQYNSGNIGLGIAGLIIGGIIEESISNRDNDDTYIRCYRNKGAWYRGHARGYSARWCRVN